MIIFALLNSEQIIKWLNLHPHNYMSKNANYDSHGTTEVKNLYDVIIIGSGPAGYTAGIYLTCKKLKTLIITGSLPGVAHDYK